MAALVPLNNACALPRLHEAGVEEVYVGFHDNVWDSRFGASELNRMSGFGREANPFSFEEMCAQIARARELGMRAFVCFNASLYTAAQMAFIASEYFGEIAQAGSSGVIVSNQGLVEAARAAGLGVVMSTVAGIFNERLAAYYRDLGATRIIVPRDLSFDEIAGIMCGVDDVEYEVFLMRNGCMFSDSHCLGCHRSGEPSLCMSLREGDVDINLTASAEGGDGGAGGEGGNGGKGGEGGNSGDSGDSGDSDGSTTGDEAGAFLRRARRNEWLLNMHYHRRTCGLCALWRFEQLGVSAYKVVGRGDDVDDLAADAALVVRNAERARTCSTEGEYLDRMERPREPETLCGMNGLGCYYPEIARWQAR